MLRAIFRSGLTAAVVLLAIGASVNAQPDEGDYDYDQVKIDRYLDVEVWSDHSDGEYYAGDDVVIYFRASRDCFASLYSIDTRGRVNLLFPTDPGEDNFIYGGVTYRLPAEDAPYDLEVTGPEGFENIQIIASRERFDIPDWYHNCGLVADGDIDEYMDYLNYSHFVRYGGQRFAYDRAAIYVNEWEDYYFRPAYVPYYPSWTVYGNCYIDYPWGSSVYINGIYWGCTPLYIPRIVVGWHTMTIYDHWGHCWESDFHCSRYNTIVFNRTVIQTSPTVHSKYKEVRAVGYRDPVKHGYPDFEAKKAAFSGAVTKGGVVSGLNGSKGSSVENESFSLPKKYVRGSSKVVKTDRGFETDPSTSVIMRPESGKRGNRETISRDRNRSERQSTNTVDNTGRSGSTVEKRSSSRNESSYRDSGSAGKSGGSSGTYRKQSGGSATPRQDKGSTDRQYKATKPSGDSSSDRGRKSESTYRSSGSSDRGKSEPSRSKGSSGGTIQKSGDSHKTSSGGSVSGRSGGSSSGGSGQKSSGSQSGSSQGGKKGR